MHREIELLREIYCFVAMKHRACDPWRKRLDNWQAEVEKIMDWDAFEEIEKHKESKKEKES